MTRGVRLGPAGWSLARQLIMLQLSVVVTAVGIEAMVAIYRGPVTLRSFQERQLLGLVTLTEVALLVGISGSLFLADRVRRQTFDMEPAEIARRYQHHDAMLHAVREGLIITDVDGRIVLANDEARRLLGLAADCEGQVLSSLVADAQWAAAQIPVTDQMEYVPGRVLMISRSPAEVDGTPAGLVTTLRDRTEVQEALRELDTERQLGIELRKQAHEHANQLQDIIALIDAGMYAEAMDECAGNASLAQQLTDRIIGQVTDVVLTARLARLHEHAQGRGVSLRLDGELTAVPAGIRDHLKVILGNLVANAIDAAAQRAGDGWVEVRLRHGADGSLQVRVRDNGGGITVKPIDDVFTAGRTTKGAEHGFGLARVRDEVAALQGTISVRNDGDGAAFEVRVPRPRAEQD